MYGKIEDGVCVRWPYTVDDLRRDNPQVSFAENMSSAQLEAYGVFEVVSTPAPAYNSVTQIAWQGGASYSIERARWETVWSVRDKSDDEMANDSERQWSLIRAERNALLSACDWTQLPDCPLGNTAQTHWAIYRQQLRDITKQVDPFNISWPQEPI